MAISTQGPPAGFDSIFPYIHFGHPGTEYVYGSFHMLVGLVISVIIAVPLLVEAIPLLLRRRHGGMYGFFLGALFAATGAIQIGYGAYWVFDPSVVASAPGVGVGAYEIAALALTAVFTVWFAMLRLRAMFWGQTEKLITNRFFMVPMVAIMSAYLSSILTRFYFATHTPGIGKNAFVLRDGWQAGTSLWVLVITLLVFIVMALITGKVQFQFQTRVGGWSASGCIMSLLFLAIAFQYTQLATTIAVGANKPVSWMTIVEVVALVSALAFSAVYVLDRRQVTRTTRDES